MRLVRRFQQRFQWQAAPVWLVLMQLVAARSGCFASGAVAGKIRPRLSGLRHDLEKDAA